MARKFTRKGKTLSQRVAKLETKSRPEVKFETGASGAFDTIGSVSGTMLYPQALASGTGRDQRIGNKVKSRNIKFQSIIKMPDSASNSTCAVRILALRSKLQDPIGLEMNNWYEPVDEDKFFVLKDILTQVAIRAVQPGITPSASTTLKKVVFNLPEKFRKLQYDGTSAQSPSNNETVIYILAENQSAEIAYNWTHYYLDN